VAGTAEDVDGPVAGGDSLPTMEQPTEPPVHETGEEIVARHTEAVRPAPAAAWVDGGRDAVTRSIASPDLGTADEVLEDLAAGEREEGAQQIPDERTADERATDESVDELAAEELVEELAHAAVESMIELVVVEAIEDAPVDEGAGLSIGQSYDSLLAAAERVLDEVDGALVRLREGGYGTCEVCGDVIADDHLETWPTARTCERHLRPAGQAASA
jgi:RNA polymerase-binding transcription factor DksA